MSNFYRGMLAAMAVVKMFDQGTIWAEIVNTASPSGLAQQAIDDDCWEWAGFDKYWEDEFPLDACVVNKTEG